MLDQESPPPSEGAQLLRASGSLSDTARRLGCAARSVSAWRAGRAPSQRARERIELVLGIPRGSWDRVAEAAPQPLPPPIDADRASSLELLRAQAARLATAIGSGTLTPRGLVEFERLALRVNETIRRLEGRSAGKPHAKTLALSLAQRLLRRADELSPPNTSGASAPLA